MVEQQAQPTKLDTDQYVDNDYKIEDIEAVQSYFEISKKEAKEYIDMIDICYY